MLLSAWLTEQSLTWRVFLASTPETFMLVSVSKSCWTLALPGNWSTLSKLCSTTITTRRWANAKCINQFHAATLVLHFLLSLLYHSHIAFGPVTLLGGHYKWLAICKHASSSNSTRCPMEYLYRTKVSHSEQSKVSAVKQNPQKTMQSSLLVCYSYYASLLLSTPSHCKNNQNNFTLSLV